MWHLFEENWCLGKLKKEALGFYEEAISVLRERKEARRRKEDLGE